MNNSLELDRRTLLKAAIAAPFAANIEATPSVAAPQEVVQNLENLEMRDFSFEDPEIIAADLRKRIVTIRTNRGDTIETHLTPCSFSAFSKTLIP